MPNVGRYMRSAAKPTRKLSSCLKSRKAGCGSVCQRHRSGWVLVEVGTLVAGGPKGPKGPYSVHLWAPLGCLTVDTLNRLMLTRKPYHRPKAYISDF